MDAAGARAALGVRIRTRAADRPQHPVHALVDAVHGAARLVDREADAPPIRCVRAHARSGSLEECALTCIPDYFEVALLLGSCFLVNYITADAKTNWVEGLIMVSFYVMIVRAASPSARLSCPR